MGVKGLWTLLEPVGRPVTLESLEGKVLAVDVSIWLHQHVHGMRDKHGDLVANAHLVGLFNRVCKLLFYKIKPIFVFDGGVPDLKKQTLVARRQQRQTATDRSEQATRKYLAGLLKQHAIGSVLSGDGSQAVPSASRARAADKPDMFELPPMPETPDYGEDEIERTLDMRATFLDMISEEFQDPEDIDPDSEDFKALPSELQYELLKELKEHRKQRRWKNIVDMPEDTEEFSNFQLKRMMNRSKLTTRLHSIRKEINVNASGDVVRDLTGHEPRDGVISQRLASDESSHYILVKGLKKNDQNPVKEKILADLREEAAKETVNVDLDKMFDEDDLVEVDSTKPKVSSLQSFNDYLAEASTSQKGQTVPQIELDYDAFGDEEIIMCNIDGEEVPIPKSAMIGQDDISVVKTVHASTSGIPRASTSKAESNSRRNQECITIDDGLDEITSDYFSKPHSKRHIPSAAGSASDQIVPLFEGDVGFESSTNSNSQTVDLSAEGGFIRDDSDESDNDVERPVDKAEKRQSNNSDICEIERSKNTEPVYSDVSSDDDEQTVQKNVTSTTEKSKVAPENSKVAPENSSEKDICTRGSTVVQPATGNESSGKGITEGQEKNLQNAPITESPQRQEAVNATSGREKPKNNTQSKSSKPAEIQLESGSEDDDFEEVPVPDPIAIDISYSPNRTHTCDVFPQPKTTNRDSPILIDDDIPEEVTPEDITPRGITTQESTAKESTGKENTAKESTAQESTAKDIIHREITAEEITAEEIIAAEISAEEITAREITDEEITDGDTIPEEITEVPVEKPKVPKRVARPTKEQQEELEAMQSQLAAESQSLQQERGKLDRQAATITDQMTAEAQELLQLFGVPFIVSPMEAEAQCAHLDLTNQTDGTVTDDSDIWLFGGKRVFKNMFNHGKYVEFYNHNSIESQLMLDRMKLINIAFLTGSDYTPGIERVGPVTAMEVLAEFHGDGLQPLRKLKTWWDGTVGQKAIPGVDTPVKKKLRHIRLPSGFPSGAVLKAYMKPVVDDSEERFTWGKPDLDLLRTYAAKKLGWAQIKTDESLLPVIKQLSESSMQRHITSYFGIELGEPRKLTSKRVKTVVNRLHHKTQSPVKVPDISPVVSSSSDVPRNTGSPSKQPNGSPVKRKQTSPTPNKNSVAAKPKKAANTKGANAAPQKRKATTPGEFPSAKRGKRGRGGGSNSRGTRGGGSRSRGTSSGGTASQTLRGGSRQTVHEVNLSESSSDDN